MGHPRGPLHGSGSHPHLVHAWLSAIRGERPALPDAETSANWTMVGLCAHESAMKGGEKIPIPQMYFARNGERYRSLGCMPITKPVKSNAATIEEIIAELDETKTSERAGRAQDHHERNAMQKLRAKGFM